MVVPAIVIPSVGWPLVGVHASVHNPLQTGTRLQQKCTGLIYVPFFLFEST
jgi:hypothetical protein